MSSTSSSSVSKKAASFMVAESMGSAAACKDQARLCRWENALRSLCQSAKLTATGRAVPDVPISSSQVAVNGSSPAASSAGGRASRSKQFQEEKLHKAYHLVCWGPN